MKQTIIYNIKSLPEGLDLDDVLEKYYATGVLLYEGKAPFVIDTANLDYDLVVIKGKEWLNLNSQIPVEDFS